MCWLVVCATAGERPKKNGGYPPRNSGDVQVVIRVNSEYQIGGTLSDANHSRIRQEYGFLIDAHPKEHSWQRSVPWGRACSYCDMTREAWLDSELARLQTVVEMQGRVIEAGHGGAVEALLSNGWLVKLTRGSLDGYWGCEIEKDGQRTHGVGKTIELATSRVAKSRGLI
jgi:hypothetical protein